MVAFITKRSCGGNAGNGWHMKQRCNCRRFVQNFVGFAGSYCGSAAIVRLTTTHGSADICSEIIEESFSILVYSCRVET